MYDVDNFAELVENVDIVNLLQMAGYKIYLPFRTESTTTHQIHVWFLRLNQ